MAAYSAPLDSKLMPRTDLELIRPRITRIAVMALMLSALSAQAYVSAPLLSRPARVEAKMAFIDTLEGTGEETGGKIWDPLDIAGTVSGAHVVPRGGAQARPLRHACLGRLHDRRRGHHLPG